MTIIAFPIKPPTEINGPCNVVFRSASYKDELGIEKTANVVVKIENGDFQGIIDSVKEQGGIWGVYENGGGFFMPWPCAFVEILPV